jgi:serine/threonine protein kinase
LGFCPFDGSTLAEHSAKTIAEIGIAETDRIQKNTGSDDLATRPYLGTESFGPESVPPGSLSPEALNSATLTGSAVANVLQGVLAERKNAPDALIGADLDGRYRIEKLIGEGGMGMVYLARHIVIEKPVAIKVLRAEVALDEAVTKRFVQEARAASRIGHPNIVDVTDFGTTKAGLTYQVMEFLEGQTLTQLIRETQPLPLARALGVIAQMARALGAAHDKGIVHRDLKPDNIFLVKRDGRDDFVKIVDFGIAKMPPQENEDEDARLTKVGTVFGTPEYMSPEQASGRVDVDLRADIYAVGTILYEMLVGRVPHKGETTVSTLAMQILDDAAPFREVKPELSVSVDLENVVMRALQKDREKRFQTMQELLDGLEEATSSTELDLPLLLKQERNSANRIVRQSQYDTVPEVDGLAAEPEQQSEPITSVREIERSARSSLAPRQRRSSRVTDPAFLHRGSTSAVPVFDSVHSEEMQAETQSSRKGLIVIAALLLVGGGVGAYALTRGDAEPSSVAAAPVPDAQGMQAAMQPSDAAPPPPIAEVEAPADAAPIPRTTETPRPRNNNGTVSEPRLTTPVLSPVGPVLTGDVEVTIITRPRGGRLVIDSAYAGSDGLNLRRSAGTKLTVRCRLRGHRDGSVKVVFDGAREVFLCKLKPIRTKRCVDGMKNPFDNCP